jgi:hypothetical protein
MLGTLVRPGVSPATVGFSHDIAAARGGPGGRRRRAAAALVALPLLLPCAAVAASPYSGWQNGPPQSAGFFPLAVWWQQPTLTGHSGSYPTIAAAVAGTKMNIMLGLGGWPEAFGSDNGELEIIKANNLYAIGGIDTPYTENTSAQSVASMLALANAIGATANLIGYSAGDEPQCGPPDTMALVPAVVAGISSFDPTRVVTYNQTAWMIQPPQWHTAACLQESFAALQATSIASFDLYPLTNPWIPPSAYFPASEAKSDFISVPNDTLWIQGLTVQALIHDGRAGQPAWVWHEAGGDNLGFSAQNNNFAGGVTVGSTTLTNVSGWSSFTKSWVGLTVAGAGIAANTTIIGITDATHAVLSAPATATSRGTTISVTGGSVSNSDCVASVNLCVVNGNEFRPTAAQVHAEVWMSIISGANGIEYFCDDTLSYSFCLGDQAGGKPAAVARNNITFVDGTVLKYAKQLNAPTVGICSMQQMNYTNGALSTTASCSNGVLTIATADPAVPGLALVKRIGSNTYLFAQSDRRSAAGASFTFTLNGLAGKTAKVLYDSNNHYDSAHSTEGTTFTLNTGAQFTDVLGANHDDYEVKIYVVN